MPLTDYQAALGRLLASNRSEDSYLAGAAAILAEPRTHRYSHDLDYFHDTPERVATAFEADQRTLQAAGYDVAPELTQPGYIRAPLYEPLRSHPRFLALLRKLGLETGMGELP